MQKKDDHLTIVDRTPPFEPQRPVQTEEMSGVDTVWSLRGLAAAAGEMVESIWAAPRFAVLACKAAS